MVLTVLDVGHLQRLGTSLQLVLQFDLVEVLEVRQALVDALHQLLLLDEVAGSRHLSNSTQIHLAG